LVRGAQAKATTPAPPAARVWTQRIRPADRFAAPSGAAWRIFTFSHQMAVDDVPQGPIRFLLDALLPLTVYLQGALRAVPRHSTQEPHSQQTLSRKAPDACGPATRRSGIRHPRRQSPPGGAAQGLTSSAGGPRQVSSASAIPLCRARPPGGSQSCAASRRSKATCARRCF